MSHLSRFVTVWSLLQARVDDGRLPGFAAAVRHRGEVEVHAAAARPWAAATGWSRSRCSGSPRCPSPTPAR